MFHYSCNTIAEYLNVKHKLGVGNSFETRDTFRLDLTWAVAMRYYHRVSREIKSGVVHLANTLPNWSLPFVYDAFSIWLYSAPIVNLSCL